MKKLNRKGYITVEILLASIISAVIAVFLIELTVKLVSKTDDAYVDTLLTTDKALIIKNIKENIETDINTYGIIQSITCSTNDCINCIISFENNSKTISISDEEINYCLSANNCTYEKKLNNALSNIKISSKNQKIDKGEYAFIQIKAENIFAENNYIINIPILNSKTEEIVEENTKYTVTIYLDGSEETSGTVISGGTYSTTVYVPSNLEGKISCNYGEGTISGSGTERQITVTNVSGNTSCNIE